MARDYLIKISLDDEKIKKLEEAALGNHITEVGGKKAIKVTLPRRIKESLARPLQRPA